MTMPAPMEQTPVVLKKILFPAGFLTSTGRYSSHFLGVVAAISSLAKGAFLVKRRDRTAETKTGDNLGNLKNNTQNLAF